MRILHTSDWHLGRSFHRVGMLEHQAQVLDDLVAVVRAEQVDAVVVAGDVYDRALPAVDAVEVLDDALARLLDAGAQVLLSSGNHDSATRLGFGGRATERAGLHLRTRVADAHRPVVLADAHGPVALYGVPYLEPGLVAGPLEVPRSHEAVLGAVTGRVRADVAARRARDGAGRRTRAVVAAHAFVVGGEPSGDERDVSVGGVGSVPAGVLTGCLADPGRPDYLALGHLHGRQMLGTGEVRYSGSPLAYSFGEAGRAKGHWLIELDAAGLARVDAVDVAPPRPLARLRGELEQLLRAPGHAAAEAAWCQVVLTDAERPRDPMAALRTRFPHVLAMTWEPAAAPREQQGYAERVAGLDDEALCCSFVEHVRGRATDDGERALLRAALEATRAEHLDDLKRTERPDLAAVDLTGDDAADDGAIDLRRRERARVRTA